LASPLSLQLLARDPLALAFPMQAAVPALNSCRRCFHCPPVLCGIGLLATSLMLRLPTCFGFPSHVLCCPLPSRSVLAVSGDDLFSQSSGAGLDEAQPPKRSLAEFGHASEVCSPVAQSACIARGPLPACCIRDAPGLHPPSVRQPGAHHHPRCSNPVPITTTTSQHFRHSRLLPFPSLLGLGLLSARSFPGPSTPFTTGRPPPPPLHNRATAPPKLRLDPPRRK